MVFDLTIDWGDRCKYLVDIWYLSLILMDSSTLAGNLYMIKQIQENMFLVNIKLLKLPDGLDRHIQLGKDHKFYGELILGI
jgi:hypothetical protein